MSSSHQNEFSERIKRAVAGDREVLMELLLDYHSQLAQFVTTQIGPKLQNTISEDDILQETFVLAFRGAGNLKANDSSGFFAWLKIIAVNRIRDVARNQQAAKRGGDKIRVIPTKNDFESRATGLIEVLAVAQGSPSGFAARHEAVDAMRIALGLLPDDQREAIRLHCFEQLTLEETAQRMDRTWDAVRGLIQRGKQSLRLSLDRSSKWLSR